MKCLKNGKRQSEQWTIYEQLEHLFKNKHVLDLDQDRSVQYVNWSIDRSIVLLLNGTSAQERY